jgi:hypothetical protein
MNAPRRLLDDRNGDAELVRLLRVARPPRPLDEAAFQRSRARVFALGAMPAALGVLVIVKHAALGAVLGATVAVTAASPRLFRSSPAAAPSASAPERVAPLPISGVRPEETAVSPTPSRAPAPVAEAAPSSSEDAGLSRELALLESARSELERRPGSALSLLARHEIEFPNGALAVEREFLVVSALERLGRRREAEARADALRARSPGSLYERRLEQLFDDGGSTP